MDRTIAPAIDKIESVTLPQVLKFTLDNGLNVHAINAGEQDVVKIEFVFKAGKWYENKNLVADLAGRMLREGTRTKTAKEVADFFDFYGSNFGTSSGNEVASVSLTCLTKYLEVQLPLLFEIFTDAVMPESELKTVITNRKQKLSVNLQKNDFLCNRYFVQALWGPQHPYGRVTEAADLDAVNVSYLLGFYKEYYNASNCFVLLSGKFSEGLLIALNNIFGVKEFAGNKSSTDIKHAVIQSPSLIQHFERENSVQSALQVGTHTMDKTDLLFPKLTVLNTIFGGYFGSRLMSNIREEKGYTYGIYSSLATYPHGTFIDIGSEVGKEVREATLQEIKNEVDLLRTELIDEEELQTVKNYMSGKVLRSVDGPMRYADTVKGLLLYNQDADYIHRLLRDIHAVTAEELNELALKYYDYDKMYKVTVG